MLSTGQLHAVSAKKSFDYRVLHHLLCGLCGIERNNVAPLFEFLALDEWLVDIGDDLVDYEDDVLRSVGGSILGAWTGVSHLVSL